jgi:cell division initiation protein
MRLTPLDIRKQEFKKAMRGLDNEEVYAFLSTIADEYEAVLNDNKALRERLLELDDKVQEYRNMEKTLRDTLLTAERVTVEAKDNARREAELIIKQAELEAEKGVRDVKSNAMKLRQEIQSLKQQRESYVARMKMLAESHMKFIQSAENDFVAEEEKLDAAIRTWESKKETRVEEAPPRPRVTPKAADTPPPRPTAPHVDDVLMPRSDDGPARARERSAGSASPAPMPFARPQTGHTAPERDTGASASANPRPAPASVELDSDAGEERDAGLSDLLDRVIEEQKEALQNEAPETSDADAPARHPSYAERPDARQPAAAPRDDAPPPPKAPGEWSLDRLKRDILSRPSRHDEGD